MASGPRPLIGLLAGAAAGLAAAAAMAAFQASVTRLSAPEAEGAGAGAGAEDDAPIAKPEDKGAAPYIVGAVMGGIYGVLTEYRPEASTGFGGAYGLATAALADPAALLDPNAESSTAEPQPWGVASHLVFGAVLEGVRWLIAGRRDR